MSNPISQAIDREVLAGLEADTSRSLVPELIGIFLKTADERIASIQDKLGKDDLDGIAAQAHALKSSSATFGAGEVRRFCAELEQAGKSGDRQQAEVFADSLAQALETARRALTDYIEELSR